MIIRRTLIIIAILLAIVIAGSVALISGGRLSENINRVLPVGWEVNIPQGVESGFTEATIPHFSLSYQDCRLISADNLRIEWLEKRKITLPNATLDYHCLSRLPHSNKQGGDTDLALLLALLPEGEIEIQALHWQHPVNIPTSLATLLKTPSKSRFAFFQQKLTASIEQKALSAQADIAEGKLALSAQYRPSEQEHHQLSLNATLNTDPLSLPSVLQADYQWKLPKQLVSSEVFRQGKANLTWQANQQDLNGHLQLHSVKNPAVQFNIPWRFEQKSLILEQAKVELPLFKAFPLNAFINAKFTPKQLDWDNLFPIDTAFKVSLLTQNAKGKGNIVFSTPNGILQKNSLNLPLQATGNIKYDDFILYSTIPLAVSGDWQDLNVRFLKGALLRLTGNHRLLNIHDLRFPLAGITVDKYGINGRLQAIFKGQSPDFRPIELHLDGYAHHFKAGASDFFITPKGKRHLTDRWQWRVWGHSQVASLKSKLNLAGRGVWQQDRIQLTDLNGDLAKIQQNGIVIPKMALKLSSPINFDYRTFQLTGGVSLNAPKIAFNYGGELEQPNAEFRFSGETENLVLNGEVKAGKLGPIRVFARRQLSATSSDLIGRLYWHEQPANVFQSLFPFRNQWLITNGTIKGETAFSANVERGLIAGGHFSIRHGSLSLPNGEIKGIDFSLPYQFKQNVFELGAKKPLEVKIDEVHLGIPLTNVRLKVQGHYPYTKRKPLALRELRLDLLGGSLNVEHFALPQTEIARLSLQHIHFEQILDLAQYHQIKLTGRANAVLPFWLNGKPCYICEGTIEQAEPAYLKFTPELLAAIQKAGYTERILAYTVNDSKLNAFSAKLNLDSKGDMRLAAKIRSQLVEHEKTKINLNYTHRENLFDLWKLINAGSQIEQQIEHLIYQKLDRQ